MDRTRIWRVGVVGNGGRSSTQSTPRIARSACTSRQLDRFVRRRSWRLLLGALERRPHLRSGGGPIEVFDPANRTIDGNGWLAGGQIGFNYQLNSFVVGIEADASWTNLKGSGSFNTAPGDVNWAIENRLDWFGTVRGRAGIAVNNFLFYATGGAAFGQSKGDLVVTNVIPCCLVTAVASAKENHVGWAAGGGIEWMYSRNWSVKAEYLHVDLGTADYHFVGTTFVGTPHTTDSFLGDFTFNVVRAGLNYRF